MITPTRRRFIGALAALIAAPAVVRFESLMPVQAVRMPLIPFYPPPAALVLADGRALNRIMYGALFEVIGKTYGGDDAAVTFNVPTLPSPEVGFTHMIGTGRSDLSPAGRILTVFVTK